jgi:serralysin
MASVNDEGDIDTATTSFNVLIDALLGEYYWSKLAQGNFQFTITDDDSDYRATRDGLINDYPDQAYLEVFPMPTASVTAIREAMDEYNKILPFAITEQGDNDVDTQIRVGITDISATHDPNTTIAYAHPPSDDGPLLDQANWMSGDIFLDVDDYLNGNTAIGSVLYFSIMHEIGHALGLKHGHEADEDTNFPALPTEFDSIEFSIMTYREFIGDDASGYDDAAPGHYAQTPMMLDIQALQYLYGADFTTRSGDTTYRWDQQGRYFINGTQQWNTQSNVIFLTIWDGGGTDTYDFTDFTTNESIDLAPGSWSNLGTQLAQLGPNLGIDPNHTARGNVFNAFMFNNNSKSLIENAVGGTGNDTISGNLADNLLDGGGGNDDILGLIGNDTLVGGTGEDELFGGNGNDTLNGGAGADLLNGGADFNTAVYASPGGDTVTITPVGNPANGRWDVTGPAQAAGDILAHIGAFKFGNGNDNITLNNRDGATTLWINGSGGNDTITGSNGVTDKDFIEGGAGSDVIEVRRGAFEVYGGTTAKDGSLADNDLLILDRSDYGGLYFFFRLSDASSPLGFFNELTEGSKARGIARIDYTGSDFVDDINGGIGNDTLRGGGGNDNFSAGDGNDLLIGGEGTDGLSGGEGNDTIIGGPGDNIFGFGGDDSIQAGGTSALGGEGNDTIIGGAADERYEGGGDNDLLLGRAGDDQLVGGLGRDTLEGGAGADIIAGNEGIDEASYENSGAAVSVNLAQDTASGGHATGDSLDSIENLRGSAFDDVLVGKGGVNVLRGLGGDDRLTGGGGADRLEGGGGADIFRYPAAAFGQDTIVGFQDGVDQISLVGSGLTFASFAEAQVGANTLLTLKSAPANTITLLNFDAGLLTAGDFIV